MQLIKRALVNKNTPFSNTRNPDLIKALKLVKCFNLLVLENVKNINETDAASAVCFQNIEYQVEDNVWSVFIDSIGDSLLTFP